MPSRERELAKRINAEMLRNDDGHTRCLPIRTLSAIISATLTAQSPSTYSTVAGVSQDEENGIAKIIRALMEINDAK